MINKQCEREEERMRKKGLELVGGETEREDRGERSSRGRGKERWREKKRQDRRGEKEKEGEG